MTTGPELPLIARMGDRELAMAVSRGLPVAALGELLVLGYGMSDVERLVFRDEPVPDRILSIDQSDRAARLIRIAVRALDAFGAQEKAWRWLSKPKQSLDGMTPLDALVTEQGGREVENMITRIEHGMAA